MDFLFVANNLINDSFKVEFVIQSFKNLGIEDSLLIALDNKFHKKRNPIFMKNLKSHKRKFQFNSQNFNTQFYAINQARRNKLISDSFVLMRKNSILIDPEIPDYHSDLIIPYPYIKVYSEKTLDLKDNEIYIPFNSSAIFKKLPDEFYVDLLLSSTKEYYSIDAFNMSCSNFGKYINFKIDSYETILSSNFKSYILDYTNGLPPYFSLKFIENDIHYWKNENEIFYELKKNHPTINSTILLKLEESYKS